MKTPNFDPKPIVIGPDTDGYMWLGKCRLYTKDQHRAQVALPHEERFCCVDRQAHG